MDIELKNGPELIRVPDMKAAKYLQSLGWIICQEPEKAEPAKEEPVKRGRPKKDDNE